MEESEGVVDGSQTTPTLEVVFHSTVLPFVPVLESRF